MANMNSAQFKSVVEPVLNEIFDGLYKEKPKQWSQVFKVEKSIKRRFQEDVQLAGLGLGVEKAEGAPVAYSSGGEAFRKVYTPRTFALAFSVTEEMLEDGDHMDFAATYTEHLARSMHEAEELYHVDVFNQAFNAGVIGGDGVSLLNTSHPLYSGGTYSNVLATPADLSEAALEELRTMITLCPDERGKKINLQPKQLVVHPADVFTAHRILESTLRVGTANNDINAIKAMGLFPGGIVELSRLTDDDAFFVTTDAPKGLIHKERIALKKGMEGDFETGSMRYKARQRYDASWTDARGLFGSAGAV
jgi:hypothetical protein